MTTSIDLQEYRSLETALTARQALDLQATGAVDVNPAWSPGMFRVTAKAVVGALALPDGLILRVTPKLPVRRVVYLLGHAAGCATWDERMVDFDDDAPIDVALAAAFAAAAESALRRGPQSGYYAVEDDLHEVRGRLDSNRQRLRYGLPLPVAVAFDEYGVDTAANRLLAGATQSLRRLPLPNDLARRLRRLASALDRVTPAARHEARLPVPINRLNEHYRSALALARVALEGLSFEVGAGQSPVTGFTVNMFVLFEKFLEVALTSELERRHGGRLSPQREDRLDEDGRATIRPDLTWAVGGAPAVVVDAKYKTLEVVGDAGHGKPADGDLYQVVSYCVGLSVRRAFLVHATAPGTPTSLKIRSSGIEVYVSGLDLGAPLGDLRTQVRALADEIGSTVMSEA